MIVIKPSHKLHIVLKIWPGVWAVGMTIDAVYTTWGTVVRNVHFHLLPLGMTLKFMKSEQDEALKSW